jgi:hypothetical protein
MKKGYGKAYIIKINLDNYKLFLIHIMLIRFRLTKY